MNRTENRQVQETTGVCFFKVPPDVDDSETIADWLNKQDFSPVWVKIGNTEIESLIKFGAVYIEGRRAHLRSRMLPGQIIRVHTRPKRFAWQTIGLEKHILVNTNELLVIDKPAGMPTHPTLDNSRENAKVVFAELVQQNLLTTHRLDIPTEGLLVFAKDNLTQASINRQFAEGRVQKLYRCLTEKLITEGLHTLFVNPASRVPRTTSQTPKPGWWKCELMIHRSQPMAYGTFLTEIELLTGKTHQIRLQMADLGAPILGDRTYGSTQSWTVKSGIALECYQITLNHGGLTHRWRRMRSISDHEFF